MERIGAGAKTVWLQPHQTRAAIAARAITAATRRVKDGEPAAVGYALHTPAGVIVHTGDFKIDYTPIDGKVIDLAKFAQLGNKGVLALMSDSTNAETPGFTKSESQVGETFENYFKKATGIPTQRSEEP